MTDLPNDRSKATDHPHDPDLKTDHPSDLDLDADRLEALIESPPAGQPVVVIQYRDRGLPWYAVLPIILLIPLVALAVYYRAMSRPGAGPAPAQPSVVTTQSPSTTLSSAQPGLPVTQAAISQPTIATENTTATAAAATPPPALGAAAAQPVPPQPRAIPSESDAPLALNSQPLAPAAIQQVVRSATALAQQAPPQAVTPNSPSENTKKETDAAQAATRVALSPPLAIGFSNPTDTESPFAELDISRGGAAAATAGDRPAADGSPETAAATPVEGQPGPQDQPTREQLLRDIQAEAAAKVAEIRQLRDVKDRASGQIEAENQARLEADRIEFRRELDEILKTGSNELGKDINDLCDRHGRNYDDELRRKIWKLLAKFGGRMSREDKVRMMRLRGVPEAGILDFLANELNHNLYARNGLQSEDAVRVTAARLLLRMKVGKEGGPTPREPQVQRSRSTAAASRGNPPGNLQLPRSE
jgi:hypothetical protein